MTNYLKTQASKHRVTHEFSGKYHFFKVESASGKIHNVTIQAGCDCKYMSVQGIANGQICSHVMAVLEDIVKHGNITLTVGGENMIQLKRNVCMKLVRVSNRILNKVRFSSVESHEHRTKKEEVCARLEKEGKHYITEAIFEDGSGKADILVLDDFKAIEIVKTETDESIAHKREVYPDGIKIEVIRC